MAIGERTAELDAPAHDTSADEVSHEDEPRRSRWVDARRPLAVFLLVFGVAALLSGGHSYSIDEETYLANLRGMLHGERVIEQLPSGGPQYLVVPDKNGEPTSFYGVGTAVFMLPGYVAGKAMSYTVADEWRESMLRLFYFGTNAVALALTAAALVLIGRELGVRDRTSTLVACCYALGTFALVHAKTGWSETLTAMFLTVALLQLLRVRNRGGWGHAVWMGLALGGAVMMRASAAVFVPVLAVAMLVWTPAGRRARTAGWLVAGLAVPGLVVGLYNWWKWGNPLDTGYPPLDYDTPLYEGVFGLLLSPGKGIAWFAPITLLAALRVRPAWASSRVLSMVLWGCVAANVAVFARFQDWSGENSYGARYMVIVLPCFAVLVLLAATRTSVDRGVGVAWIAGLVATVGGSVAYFNAVYNANAADLRELTNPGAPASVPLDWTEVGKAVAFVPRASALAMHTEAIPHVIRDMVTTPWATPPINPVHHGVQSQMAWYWSSLRLDTWWWYWHEFGAPSWVLLLVLVPIGALVAGALLLRPQPVRLPAGDIGTS